MEMNEEPKELEIHQTEVGTVNGERSHNGGRRKVKVKTRGVG